LVDSLEAYLERLASSDAVPGGGSAAAVTGSLAAALVAMVGRIHATSIPKLVADADRLRDELGAARRRDEQAYARVVDAQALPKRDETERATRQSALEAALHDAAEAPLAIAALALAVLGLLDRLLEVSLGALGSDVGCAAEFAGAALAAAAYNVRINHRYMKDAAVVRDQAARLAALEDTAAGILKRARDALAR
jgi:formiminotetrahydrofolate cyclodeaminase